MIPFAPIERMNPYSVSLTLDTGQARVNLGTEVIRDGSSFPFGRKAKGWTGEALVRADHRAPEIALEV